MSVFIYQPNALDLMAKVEGMEWKRLQERDRQSPHGFYAYLESWNRLAKTEYAGQMPICVKGGDGAIYGEGGYARYTVRMDGEIMLLRWSTRQERIDLAEQAGIRIWG